MSKGNFDLDDFAKQLKQMGKMGGVSGIMSMLPGISKAQKVMAENKRLLVLPQVVAQFRELKAEHEKTLSVDVTSAVELTAEQETTLCAALEKRLARKVKLTCKIDANVVSGLVIKAGDMVIDGSVRGKLSRLATIMQS